MIDEYLDKVEEWVERSHDKVRADTAHEQLLVLGYTGSERTTHPPRGREDQVRLPGW